MTCLKVPAGRIPDFTNRGRKSTKYLNSFTSNCCHLWPLLSCLS